MTTPQDRLNFGVNLANLFRWSNKLAIEGVAVGSRIRGWREHSPTEGEQWLRRAAENGDFYAMEALGLRLFNAKAFDEGIAWLTKSSELGNPGAMTHLAECLMDMQAPPDTTAKAERWLRQSIECGSTRAMVILGSRLIVGLGLTANPDSGKRLLAAAAQHGSQLAHIKLGTYLLSENREEGLRWLRRIGACEGHHISSLAYYVYMKSLDAPTQVGAHILAEEAASLFQEAIRQGRTEEQVNLAYLLRRGEIGSSLYPSIETLLASHVFQEKPAALMNQALRVAAGVECTAEWRVADILVGKIKEGDALLAWWFARSEEGDPEGHLVTGWLVRHHLASDPDGIPLTARMSHARDGGWAVPDWMSHPSDPPGKH